MKSEYSRIVMENDRGDDRLSDRTGQELEYSNTWTTNDRLRRHFNENEKNDGDGNRG